MNPPSPPSDVLHVFWHAGMLDHDAGNGVFDTGDDPGFLEVLDKHPEGSDRVKNMVSILTKGPISPYISWHPGKSADVSDLSSFHSPDHNRSRSVFRFQKVWTLLPGFDDLIRHWWSSTQPRENSALNIVKKLRVLRYNLKQWEKSRLKSIRRSKRELSHAIKELVAKAGLSSLTSRDKSSLSSLTLKMHDILQSEDLMERERSRERLFMEDDQSKSYFDRVANVMRHTGIQGNHSYSLNEVIKGADSHFRMIFSWDLPSTIEYDWDSLDTPNTEDLSRLDLDFDDSEFKQAVFDMEGDMPPGPDGFPMMFFQRYWEVVGPDICSFLRDYFSHKVHLGSVNHSWILLIPKNDGAETISDYKLITRSSCLYLIVTKVLATRLNSCIGTLINMTRSTFIRKPSIVDNIPTMQEVFLRLKESAKDWGIIKLDFEKGFAKIHWNFLMNALKAKGFSDKWLRWVWECLSTSKLSALVNGECGGDFKMGRGLKQGCPLSPMLFIIALDILDCITRKLSNIGHIKGIGHPKWEGSNLHFGDETFLFCQAETSQVAILKFVVRLFTRASGMEIDFARSSLYYLGQNKAKGITMAKFLNCKIVDLPTKYLTLPISNKCLQVNSRSLLIEKIEMNRPRWREYIEELVHANEAGGKTLCAGTFLNPGSWDAALLAAGTTLSAMKHILDGHGKLAYALVRPPGHHAQPSQADGYCFLNNGGLAAQLALDSGCSKVAVIDIDVHYGNGMADAFFRSDKVLTISLHMNHGSWGPSHPQKGSIDEVGESKGFGYNLNIPLPNGTGDRGYMYAMNELVIPAVQKFEPMIIVLAFGQDSSAFDPNGRQCLTMEGYREIGRVVRMLANGRLLIVQEGGYHVTYSAYCLHALIEGVLGLPALLLDPIAHYPEDESFTFKVVDEIKQFWRDTIPFLKEP